MSSSPDEIKLDIPVQTEHQPSYYIQRVNDLATPLVPLDELPEWFSIKGLTRYVPTSDLDGDSILPYQERCAKRYDVQIAMPHLEKVMAKTAAESHGGMPSMVPSHASINERVNRATGDQQMPGAERQDSAPVRGDPRTVQTYNPTTPGVLGKKVYCTHWLRTGECDFTQQGCMFLHVMPDIPMLETLGFKCYPRWFREMDRSYQEEHALTFDPEGLIPHRRPTGSQANSSAKQSHPKSVPVPGATLPDQQQGEQPPAQESRHRLQREPLNKSFSNGVDMSFANDQNFSFTHGRNVTSPGGYGLYPGPYHFSAGPLNGYAHPSHGPLNQTFHPGFGNGFSGHHRQPGYAPNHPGYAPQGPMSSCHMGNSLVPNINWNSRQSMSAPPSHAYPLPVLVPLSPNNSASASAINLTRTHALQHPIPPRPSLPGDSTGSRATTKTKRSLADIKPLEPEPNHKRPQIESESGRPIPYMRNKVEKRDPMDGAPNPPIIHPRRFTDKKFMAPDARLAEAERIREEGLKRNQLPSLIETGDTSQNTPGSELTPTTPINGAFTDDEELLMDLEADY